LAKYIGEKRDTSIKQSQYCNAFHSKFWLSSPEILNKLQSNNLSVVAYRLPYNEDIIHIYQNEKYIDTCIDIETFNENSAEHTEKDIQAMQEQSKYISKFRSMVKEKKTTIPAAHIIETCSLLKSVNVDAETIPDKPPEPAPESSYIDAIISGDYTPELAAKFARNNT
jgi:acetyl-CoA carboxylase beta subunit